jgi:hypothetical protein
VQRPPRLSQREVERGRLEPPAAELRQALEQRRERLERVLADEPGRRAGGLEPRLVLRVVENVLAEPLVAGPLQVDDRPADQELLRDAELEPLEGAALDGERQIGEQREGGYFAPRTSASSSDDEDVASSRKGAFSVWSFSNLNE